MIISPSILSADFKKLESSINEVQDFINKLIPRKKEIEFEITVKNEDNHQKYRLELMSNEIFFFPIFGVLLFLRMTFWKTVNRFAEGTNLDTRRLVDRHL